MLLLQAIRALNDKIYKDARQVPGLPAFFDNSASAHHLLEYAQSKHGSSHRLKLFMQAGFEIPYYTIQWMQPCAAETHQALSYHDNVGQGSDCYAQELRWHYCGLQAVADVRHTGCVLYSARNSLKISLHQREHHPYKASLHRCFSDPALSRTEANLRFVLVAAHRINHMHIQQILTHSVCMPWPDVRLQLSQYTSGVVSLMHVLQYQVRMTSGHCIVVIYGAGWHASEIS